MGYGSGCGRWLCIARARESTVARPLRIEYAGACYHVMNRGNQRARVFHSPRQYRLFLEKLERFALQFDVRVHSYCLMPNHFHVVLTTRRPNLSRFMQSWLASFTLSINRMRRNSGHVFQGRFRAHLVETQRYVSAVSRYVHLNPVRTTRAKELPLAQRRALLRDFEWSSFPVLIGLRQAPDWMDVAPVLGTWGTGLDACMRNYRQYVEQGLTVDLPSPFLSVREQSILGSDSFVDQIRRRYLLNRKPAGDGAESALAHLVHSLDPDEVLAVVAELYGVTPLDLLKRRSPFREARRVGMYFTAVYCRHTHSLINLAGLFSVSLGGLCTTRARVEHELGRRGNRELRLRVAQILDAIRKGYDDRTTVDS